jgi:hypothetical protein
LIARPASRYFTFEIVEAPAEEETPYVRDAPLTERFGPQRRDHLTGPLARSANVHVAILPPSSKIVISPLNLMRRRLIRPMASVRIFPTEVLS